jgi:hypothetical protein
MLIKATALMGYKFDSLDGEIGKVKEFYFDDRHWAVRYLVADTGQWMSYRQVLISPYALGDVNREKQNIAIDLTKKQIENSPPLDSDKPVSKQFEDAYHEHYGWPVYWNGPSMWGFFPDPAGNRANGPAPYRVEKPWDPHLRSTHSVTGHRIQATDGEIGHAKDFIIDDETWAIRYLIIDTGNWWPGKKVLVSPRWIERVSWTEESVFVNLSRESIKRSPEYTDESPPTRDYETILHRHYDFEAYWCD